MKQFILQPFSHIYDLSSEVFTVQNFPLIHSRSSFQRFILGSIPALFYALSLDDLNISVSSTAHLLLNKISIQDLSLNVTLT